ncbi:hypothetical protein A6764_18545 [Brevibacillus sp. WF146]|jgi:hypothetical protein|uniref:hypothetical protein n=1 Tax=Brevibacillus sp. WF146 TaxID=319501 RepID=UPI000B338C30|nr:hypothetical protein [Brevibacillus sp. WF146]UYZ12782.1 hypothetical protein A6764_18545 [Brevibacillus sp. WF146]
MVSKKPIAVMLPLALAFSIVGVVHATEEQKEKKKDAVELLTHLTQEKFPNAKVEKISLKEYLEIEKKFDEADKGGSVKQSDSVQPFAGSAPPYSTWEIAIVDSEADEGPDGYQDVVGLDEAPIPVRGNTAVYTYTIGHGYKWAWLDGEAANTTNGYVTNLYSIDTNRDGVVDGYWYEVAFNSDDKISSWAEFKSRGVSYNFPNNTMEDSITIYHE